jgi:hypothetical protein
MRKYILVLLVLSGVAAAQRLRVPMLHRDPVDAQRAALHEKMTRLAETRSNAGMPEAQSASSLELDALTASAQPKRPASPATKQRVTRAPATTASAWPPPPQAWTAADREPSLGDVARTNRVQKRQSHPKSEE